MELLLQPCLSVWLLLNLFLVLIQQASIRVQGLRYTSFSYPTFSSTNKLLLNRDAQYMPSSSSVWLNSFYNGSLDGKSYDCGSLIYAESIQMMEPSDTVSTGLQAVASFNTSFTFSMSGENSAGFAFMFVVNNHTTGAPGGQLCLLNYLNPNVSNVLAVEFDTWQNPEYLDLSNNHVGVNNSSMRSTAVYNLCRDGISTCDYFVTPEGSSEQDFTSWIDYDSATGNLEVFLANGSVVQGVLKPAKAIIQVPGFDISNVVKDYMFVGFSGSGAMYKEVKKIKSWNFRTSNSNLWQKGLPLSPSNGRRENVKKIVGIIIGALVGGMVVIGIGFKFFSVFGRPLRFFLSHAGGEEQEGKNFPDWLYNEMTSSWKLKYFIKVFLDRRCLPKGKLFPKEIMLELENTQVGVVIVTKELFERKWPMTELVAFVKAQETNPAVRILPLFYRMNVGEIGDNLRRGIWEDEWRQMSSNGNHPILADDCRHAVKKLCESNGIEYVANNRGYDREYVKRILKDVGKILREEQWKRLHFKPMKFIA